MKAFFPFLLIPLSVGAAVMFSPTMSGLFVRPVDPISVQQLTLPVGAKDIKTEVATEGVSVVRLEALMPSRILEQVSPPVSTPVKKTASERYRLSSVLLSPERRSAIINGEVKMEGARLDEFRVARITKDSVMLRGPDGKETVKLDSLESSQLFRITNIDKNKVSFLVPPKPPATPIPPDELERQFRHLLENFSH